MEPLNGGAMKTKIIILKWVIRKNLLIENIGNQDD